MGLTLVEPDVALLPLHAPEAVHVLAFEEVQVSVEDWPEIMLVGLAFISTVGGRAVTVSVKLVSFVVPPFVPLTVIVYEPAGVEALVVIDIVLVQEVFGVQLVGE